MVNIMAFKIHNKYKYFIHFPKKPYLCKTNKQDRTINNLLTHYPVNWIDGMKLSSSHKFIINHLSFVINIRTFALSIPMK